MTGFVPALAIIRRELLSSLRRPQSFRNLLFVLFPLMIVWCALMSLHNSEFAQAGNAIVSRTFFSLYVFVLFTAGLLIGVTMGAIGIASEREADTLDLLRMTYISPSAIIFAKLVSALGLTLLTITASLPLLGLQFFFTGVDPQQFLQALVIILSTTFLVTMTSLTCSAVYPRTLKALGTSFAWAVLFNGGFFVLLYLLNLTIYIILSLIIKAGIAQGFSPQSELLYVVACVLCPPFSLFDITVGGFSEKITLGLVLFHTLVFLAAWQKCVRALKRTESEVEQDVSDRPNRVTHRFAGREWRLPWSSYPYPLPDGHNPMYFKELLESSMAFRRNAPRIFFAVLGLTASASFVVLFSHYGGFYNLEESLVYIATLLFLAIIPATIAPTIAREHTFGNMDALRMTLLHPDQVLKGKLYAALRNVALPYMALTLGGLPLFLSRVHQFNIIAFGVMTALTMLLCAFYILSLSILVSSTTRTTLQALARAYAVSTLALFIVPYCIAAPLNAVFRRAWADYAMCTSPYFSHMINFAWHRQNTFNLHSLGNVVIFTALSLLVLHIAQRRFRKYAGFSVPEAPQ